MNPLVKATLQPLIASFVFLGLPGLGVSGPGASSSGVPAPGAASPGASSSGAVAEGARSWVLDDFDDGDLVAEPGLSWFALADDMVGGASEVRLEVRRGGPAGSRHALGLRGRLAAGKRSFAGAWVSLDRTGRSVDLGAFDGIRLRVKSRVALQVGIRSGMVNFMADVAPGDGWRLVEVPFSTLAPLGKAAEGTRWNPVKVETFGVTTPQLPGAEDRAAEDLAVEIDEIVLYGRGEGSAAPVAVGPPGSSTVAPFTPLASIPAKGWVVLAEDAAGDGRMPSLPDATRLETIPSTPDGLLWLRVSLSEAPHDRWIGLNAVLDVDGDPANGTEWWGANKVFKFDRLVSVWCMRVEEGCQGVIGAADADQVASGVFADGAGGVRLAIDRERRAFVVGIPRDSLRVRADQLRMVVAVGSALSFNDDVPGEGAVTLR
jgi:hypothetical protein